jgi:hypothetical protein
MTIVTRHLKFCMEIDRKQTLNSVRNDLYVNNYKHRDCSTFFGYVLKM